VTRIAVIYYSATGNVHALARAVAEGAADEGAEVRLPRVAERREEMLISFKQYWGRHRFELEDQPEAQLEDIEWADGIAFGTPTRFGNVAGQLKVFLDLAGELWQQGKLIDKVATAFTSAQTEHGGYESTILGLNNTLYHWGDRASARLHGAPGLQRGRKPVRHLVHERPPRRGAGREKLLVARAQGARLARLAGVIGAARAAGLLTAKAPAETTSSNRKE